jgi:hypothetical protein
MCTCLTSSLVAISRSGEAFEDGERIGFYSQPGPVPSSSAAAVGGGGVGKYLGAKSSTTLPKLAASQEGGGGASAAEGLLRQSTGVAVPKAKPPVAGSQFKDFSGW